MAVEKLEAQNRIVVREPSIYKGSIINSVDIRYVYNPTTMDGFIMAYISTNAALSANTAYNLIQLTDSLLPVIPSGIYASAEGLPVVLHNINQKKLHHGYLTRGMQLRYEDSQSIGGVVAFDILIPVHFATST